MSRERLASYERKVVRLPCEIGLRICRTWIISEEWLATGKLDGFHESFRARYRLVPGFKVDSLDAIAVRQCVDLLHERVSREVPTNMSLAEAFPQYLAESYNVLVLNHFFLPRVVVENNDRPELLAHYASTLVDRWLKLLSNEASKRGLDPFRAQRAFSQALTENGNFLFLRAIGNSTPAPEFLRELVADSAKSFVLPSRWDTSEPS